MTITPEQLAAYIDGECGADEAQLIERAAQTDPALAERIGQERTLRASLRSHFAPVADEPMPAAWESMIRAATGTKPGGGAVVTDLSEARARRAGVAHRIGGNTGRLPWMGGALAASLVLGLMVGLNVRNSGPIAARNGALIAQGELARALDTQLASAQDDVPVHMLLSFKSTDGAICRAFSGREASGIACRSGDAWQLRHVLPGGPEPTTEYRQAGSRQGEISTLAQAIAAGDAFDERQERAARAKGWR